MEKPRGNWYKVLLQRLTGHRRKIFHNEKKNSRWNNLFREVVDYSRPDTLKIQLNGCWAILSRLHFCQERLDHIVLEVPSNLVFYDNSVLNLFRHITFCKRSKINSSMW